jgi:hypothetical protein
MINECLINKIFKNLHYGCFLNVSSLDIDSTFLLNRNWECIVEKCKVDEVYKILDEKYPTIFHYSWIGTKHVDVIVDYIEVATSRSGWQKRFILIGFEDISLTSDQKLKSLFYHKIDNMDGHFYIHELYKHYLNRK